MSIPHLVWFLFINISSFLSFQNNWHDWWSCNWCNKELRHVQIKTFHFHSHKISTTKPKLVFTNVESVESFIRQNIVGDDMRKRNVESLLNSIVTSVNSRQNTGNKKVVVKRAMRRDHRAHPSNTNKVILFWFFSLISSPSSSSHIFSHNLRSHQKIRHAEYHGDGVTITTVRNNRSSNRNSSSIIPTQITSSTTPHDVSNSNLNTTDSKTNILPSLYKNEWDTSSILLSVVDFFHKNS